MSQACAFLLQSRSAYAQADLSLAYETIEPSSIRLGESATIRVTSLDGYLESVPLPTINGLTFAVIGRQQGFEFVRGTTIPSSYILIRVTPQFVGVFSIPGLTPASRSLGLEVVSADNPNPLAWRNYKQSPAPPPPKATASLPKGAQLKAGGAAFVPNGHPARAVYVGESVPIDIEVGLRPGIVTSLNGLPTLNGGDFTLNNLSRQPERRDEVIGGSPFVLMTWHSVLAAVKPGRFLLPRRNASHCETQHAIGARQRVRGESGLALLTNHVQRNRSERHHDLEPPVDAEGIAAAHGRAAQGLQWCRRQLPGIERHFARPASGGGSASLFACTSAAPATSTASTSSMLDRLDHWKTYPPRSSFTKSDAVGYHGGESLRATAHRGASR